MANEVAVITDYDAVPEAIYLQAEAYLRQLLGERFPNRSFATGRTFYWGIVVPNALAQAGYTVNVQMLLNSLYLEGIRNNPDTATDELVDLTLSNYYVTRQAGTNASGTVSVIVTRRQNYTIQSGSQFLFGSQEYNNPETIFVYTQAAQVVGANDRLLTERSDGRFEFTVPVIAAVEGIDQFLPAGSFLTLQNAPTTVQTVATITDISGGANEETTAELIDRIPTSLAAQTFAGENQTKALITSEFPGTKVSMTGMGDAELHRDKNNLTGLSGGGMSDVWNVTSTNITTKLETFSAELIDKAGKLWRAQIPTDLVAGVYGALRVLTPNSDTIHEIQRQERGFTVPDIANPPRIFTGVDAAFSPYQTIAVVFQDVSKVYTTLTEGDTDDYTFQLLNMPLVQAISDFLINSTRTDRVTNVVVRGACTCVTNVSLIVRLLDGDFESAIDQDAMKASIVQKLYDICFDYGVLSVSHIMDAVHDFINGRSDVSATRVSMTGTILAPTGETLFLSDDQELRIPDLPDKQVTAKTTVFLTDVSRVDLTFERVET